MLAAAITTVTPDKAPTIVAVPFPPARVTGPSLPADTAPRRAFDSINGASHGVGGGLARGQHLLDQLLGAQPVEVFGPGFDRRMKFGGLAAAADHIWTTLQVPRPDNSRRSWTSGGVVDGTGRAASTGRKLGVTAGGGIGGRCRPLLVLVLYGH